MPDHFVDTDRDSAGSNFLGSLLGPFIGMFLLWWSCGQAFDTEKHAVRVERALNMGEKDVRVLTPQTAADLQDKLVYYTANAKALTTPTDPDTGVSAPGLRLMRYVEMFQWDEDESSDTHKELGGGTTTTHTYDYRQKWSDSHIDSSRFKHQGGHYNPPFVLPKKWFDAQVTLGDYAMPADLLKNLTDRTPLILPLSTNLQRISGFLQMPVNRSGNFIYAGNNINLPAVGDMRISYDITPEQPVSIVAMENGKTFAPYLEANAEPVYLIQAGTVSIKDMFKHAQEANQTELWMKRVLWWMLTFIALLCIIAPINQIANIIPFVGDMVEWVTAPLALFGSLLINGVIIISSWFILRPMFSAIVFAVLLIAGGVIMSVAPRKDARR